MNFVVSVDFSVKIKENEKWDKYLDLAWELKKALEREGDGDTDCSLCTRNYPQRIDKMTGRLGNKKTSEYHPDYSIIKISQNIEKSPGDLRRLAVTQTTVKDYQQALVGKTHLE